MTLSVVVGRFQVDQLHEGHRYLLDHAQSHGRLLVCLGVGPLPTTSRKPLPYETRKAIIEAEYPDAIFEPVYDHFNDDTWSQNLDNVIKKWTWRIDQFEGEIFLFCSRDSFKPHYSGIFQVAEVPEADLGVSGTLHRKRLAEKPSTTQEFAKGVIWANENKFPTVYGAVDAAILKDAGAEILLITKEGRPGWLFPGGFTDPGSESDEADALREVKEETNIDVAGGLSYIGSMNIRDWRYDKEIDSLRTRMFWGVTVEPEQTPIAGDDAATAQWVETANLKTEDFNISHQPLFEMLKERVKL